MRRLISFLSVLLLGNITACRDEHPVTVVTGIVTHISSEGALFSAVINSTEVQEYGFVWSVKANPTKASTPAGWCISGADRSSGSFSQMVRSDLTNGKTYYVRAYVVTTGSTIYGGEVTFVSQGSKGPSIISFSPSTGTGGALINIQGSNFSFKPSNNVVAVGPVKCTVISASDTEIKAQIISPLRFTGTYKVSVTVDDKTATSLGDFTVL